MYPQKLSDLGVIKSVADFTAKSTKRTSKKIIFGK